MWNKLLHQLLQRVLVVHDHLAQPGVLAVTTTHTHHHGYYRDDDHSLTSVHRLKSCCVFQSPGSVRHLVSVVVQSDDGLPLLYTGQDRHQSRVGDHQVQVVLGQVKVHRLTGSKKTVFLMNNISSEEKIIMRVAV